MGARYYEPSTGLFLTKDPVALGTIAAYAYAAGSPQNFTDPTGFGWWNSVAATVVGGIGAFVGNAIDNLHSGNPALVVLGGAESVVIAAPIALVIFYAGGGAAVSAALDALAPAAPAALDATEIIAPRVAAQEAGAGTARVFGQAVWGRGAAAARALIGTRNAAQLRALGLTPRLAAGLRNFYQAAAEAGEGGAAASARAELMQHISEVLTKG